MIEEIAEKARKALLAKYSLKELTMEWRRPQEKAHGDIATAVALQIAKDVKKKPQEIAQALCAELQKSPDVERAEVAGAGYVNVWLTPEALLKELSRTHSVCLPQKQRKKEAPVVIEYSGPNIAKPLGIHHILSTVIGQVLVNLHRHLGYSVVATNHFGDWGTQFGKLSEAYSRWGEGPIEEYSIDQLLSLYVRFHDEAEKDPSLEDAARASFRKLEEGDPAMRTFWKATVSITMDAINCLYKRLHVHFDCENGESFYEKMMAPILEEGKKKQVIVPGEKGAFVVEFPDEQLPPAVVLKADGATIYLTRDLATVRYRIETWHPREILYVVDRAQELYFRQIFATVRHLGWDLPALEHVVFGRMRFADGSMSTRKGNIVRLESVLDEAVERAGKVIAEHGEGIQTDDRAALQEMMGVGAVVYGILSQNRKMDMQFDWQKALSLEGNSAPYLQYTHARARSVLRKADLQDAPQPMGLDALTDRERSLTGVLLQFADVLEEARAQRMPHTLANYLFSLCQEFNSFYNVEPILKAEGSQRSLRLFLTSLTAMVIKTGAELLTLRVPDRM
ncbi:MAG: arginine--tRNA ligase [Candidatus Peregrinibacteria bacterium]